MENPSQPSLRLDFIGLLKIIFKWRKQLVITGIAAAVTAFIFTRPFILPPRYKSTAVVYPSNLTPYSTESPTETMLQMLASDQIKYMLIKDFNLYNHYKINSAYPLARTYMFDKLAERISINRTQYESIEITVIDESPKAAAAMCDSILAYCDRFIRSLMKQKFNEVVELRRQAVLNKKATMDSLENVLSNLREKYGIVDFKAQARELARAMYKGNGNSFLNEQYKNLKDHGGEEFALTEHLFRARGFYNDAVREYDLAVNDRDKNFTFSNKIIKPEEPQVKHFPKGTIIIASFTAAVLFFALLIIVIIEMYRSRWKNEFTAS